MHSAIAGSKLYMYSEAEQGDHFLMFKNPVKFTTDLREFLSSATVPGRSQAAPDK